MKTSTLLLLLVLSIGLCLTASEQCGQVFCLDHQICCGEHLGLPQRCFDKCMFKKCPAGSSCRVSLGQALCYPLGSPLTTTATTTATTTNNQGSTVATTTVSTTALSSTVATTTVSTASTVASTVASTTNTATSAVSTVATTTVSTQSTVASTVASTVSQATATPTSTTVSTTVTTTASTSGAASTITQTTSATTTVTTTATSPATASTVVSTTVSTQSTVASTTVSTAPSTGASTGVSTTSATPTSTTVSTTVTTTASTSGAASTITQTTSATTTVTTTATGGSPSSTVASTTVSTQSTVASTTVSTGVSTASATQTSTTVTTTATTTASTTGPASTITQTTSATTTVTTTASGGTPVTSTVATTTVSTQSTVASTVASTVSQASAIPTSTTVTTTVTTTASTSGPASTITQTTSATTTVSTTSTPVPTTTTASTTMTTTASTVGQASTITATTTATTTVSTTFTSAVITSEVTTSTPVTSDITGSAATSEITGSAVTSEITGSAVTSEITGSTPITGSEVTSSTPTTSVVTSSVTTSMAELFTLSGKVWDATNSDSIALDLAKGLGGATMTLMREDGTQVEAIQTGADGSYTFNGLAAGKYCIRGAYSEGSYSYGPFYGDNKFENGKVCATVGPSVSDLNLAMIKSTTFFVQGLIWDDTTENQGNLDKNNLFNGATMQLKDSKGEVLKTFVAGEGKYMFNGLVAGDYCIEGSDPTGNYVPGVFKHDNKFNHGRYCFTVSASMTDAHLAMTKKSLFTIAGSIWDDSALLQGKLDPSKLLSGANMELFDNNGKLVKSNAAAPGTYSFEGLEAGYYCVIGHYPDGYKASPKMNDNVFEEGKYCVVVGPNVTNAHFAMMKIPATFSIKGFIWDDTANNQGTLDTNSPLMNVRIDLYDDHNHVVRSLTNTQGNYLFDGLEPGQYCATAFYPDGSYIPGVFQKDNVYDKGRYCVTLGPDSLNANLAMIQKPSFSVSGIAWDDSQKKEGKLDTQAKLDGTKFQLLDGNNKPLRTIDYATGNYEFSGLDAGSYCIIATYEGNFSPEEKKGDNVYGSDGKYCFQLGPSITNAHLALIKGTFMVKGFVWDDSADNKGNLDTSKPIGTVTMELRSKAGDLIDSKKGITGEFTFKDVPEGQYCMTAINTNTGYVPGAFQNDNLFNKGQYCFTISTADVNDANFALIKKVSSHLSVWDDTADNKGTMDSSKLLKDVPVKIFDDAGKIVLSSVTSDAGLDFDLAPGSYCMELSPPDTTYMSSTVMANDNQFDSNGKHCFKVEKDPLDLKGAMVKHRYSVSGFAWDDGKNKQGNLDKNSPMGLVDMDLLDKDGKKIKSLAGVSGAYTFTDLLPGDYCIKASVPDGSYLLSAKALKDNKFANGQACFTVADKNVIDIDISGFKKASITINVWDDTVDNKGVFDNTKLVPGMHVVITDTDDNNAVIKDLDFDNTVKIDWGEGNYCAQLTVPTGFTMAAVVQGDNKFDSTGKYCFKLTGDMVADAALNKEKFRVQGTIWDDTLENDGNLDKTKLLPGVKLVLRDSDKKDLLTLDTTGGEFYHFDDLLAGKYCIHATYPAGGMWPSLQGNDNKLDDDGDYCFTLGPSITDGNLAFIKRWRVSGYAWDDTADKQGKVDATKYLQKYRVVYTNDKGKVLSDFVTSDEYFVYVNGNSDLICLQITKDLYTPLGVIQNDNKFDSSGKYCLPVDKDIPNQDCAMILTNKRR
ncbi:hypothetical protein SAMD00019534_108180 [Acytostelium subglobosum LB1]|uniref:hypothetical protein n=1 Tax=Acytostelium subglobosum LB1 TaxID=1410327 RepID=UPI000644B8ED|nr:hypothetical protein SAMD00019534_108180 [Acytostelium subglobosum LB1]GAM27642.1 hypothetical protein SAMD00019534_108180 [Acytostelium subglobosum LB1]|eukprot:XP_012749301.1 hypothetical protein SAMD00019534_108180 [Acytostelium subglobosum LB1]